MKKLCFAMIATLVVCVMLSGCYSHYTLTDKKAPLETNASESGITKEMAYEGVSNYCQSEYDWSIAEENPSIMYIEMGEESESAYQVIFRSYTGAFLYFYVDKATGNTKMVEHVPTLNVENEVGQIDLHDYLPHD